MALVHVYNGVGSDCNTYRFDGPLCNHIKDIDWAHTVILRGGEKIGADYYAKKDDVIFIRRIPSSMTTAAIIIIAAAVIVGGIVTGVNLYKQREQLQKLEEAQKAAKSASQTTTKLPFVRGANNQPATGQTFPYIIGETLFTPYRLCPAHYTIAGNRGDTQYYNVILECGFNSLLIKQLALGNTIVKKWSDTEPQNGVYNFDAGTYYDERNKIEIRQSDEFSDEDFNKKIILTELTTEVPHDHASDNSTENATIEKEWQAGVVQECADNPMSVEMIILFSDGLCRYDDGWKSQSVTLQPQWTNNPDDPEPTWNDFSTGFFQAATVPHTARFRSAAMDISGEGIAKAIADMRTQWVYKSGDTATPPATDIDSTKIESIQLVDVLTYEFTYTWYSDLTSNTFSMNTRKQMRFSIKQAFTAAQAYGKKISVRLRRTTPKCESNSKESVYLLAVQTTCYDPKKSNSSSLVAASCLESDKRKKCTRIGIRIAANENTKDMLESFSIISAGVARTWNGTAWSTTKSATRNLAAWVLEILTSDAHPASKYNDNELDLATFGAWYEYCDKDKMEFYADGAITKSQTKKQTINTLLTNGNAALVTNEFTGLLEVAIDNGRDHADAVINPENIYSMSVSKEFNRKTDGKKVTYVNRDGNYDVDTVTFMRDGGEYDPQTDTLTETGLEYITSYAHAYKYAWRQMAEELSRPQTATVKVGRIGAYYPLFDCVDVQHRCLKIGISSAVINSLAWYGGILKTITLDGYVDFPADKSCGVVINCASDTAHGVVCLKVTGTGRTNTLTVTSTLSSSADIVPTAGNELSFGCLDTDGNFSLITTRMIIVNAEPADDGYTLTLKDYNADLYTYGALPEYKTNITTAPNSTPNKAATPNYIDQADATEAADSAAQEAANLITHGVRFSSIHKIDVDPSATLENIIAKIDDDAKQTHANISMTAEEILLSVDDEAKELRAVLDIQAGAIQAIVTGGGTSGQMSLSLELPIIVNAATRAKLVKSSTETDTAAVYAKVENTEYYAIRGDASDAQLKKLWDAAVSAGLLSSQIVLNANQIQVDGQTVFSNSKVKESLLDLTNTTAAISDAQKTADDAASNLTNLKKAMGDLAYLNTVEKAKLGTTIIDGGYIKTTLLDVDAIAAKVASIDQIITSKLTINSAGEIVSSDFYNADGTESGNGYRLKGGTIKANNAIFNNCTLGGFLYANNTPFAPIAMLDLGYNNSAIQLSNNKNISSVSRGGTGTYTVTFSTPIKLKTHTYGSNKYIDLFVVGNAADTFDNGFSNPIIPTCNWLRQYVDGRLTVDSNGYATVTYFVLYFADNSSDQLEDPRSSQVFIFGTEAN